MSTSKRAWQEWQMHQQRQKEEAKSVHHITLSQHNIEAS